jgi:RNA polymerase sigma-70 factor (ECF subfamily)
VQPNSESALLERARDYDAAAIAELYDRYSLRIYNYVYRRVGSRSLAEDLTSTVFVRVLEAVRTSKAWRSSFSGWLYRIAHNAVVDHFRSGDRDKDLPLEDITLPSNEHPVEEVERSMTRDRLRTAINGLTEAQGLVITLKFMQGMTNAEVAALMGRNEGAIKSLQFRGLAALKRAMDEEPS